MNAREVSVGTYGIGKFKGSAQQKVFDHFNQRFDGGPTESPYDWWANPESLIHKAVDHRAHHECLVQQRILRNLTRFGIRTFPSQGALELWLRERESGWNRPPQPSSFRGHKGILPNYLSRGSTVPCRATCHLTSKFSAGRQFSGPGIRRSEGQFLSVAVSRFPGQEKPRISKDFPPSG